MIKKVLVFLSFFLSFSLVYSESQFLENIPSEEVLKIRFLFQKLFYDHDFSYTIFGSKPMSLADLVNLNPTFNIYDQKKMNYHLNITESLNSWDNYKSLLQSDNFFFLENESDICRNTRVFCIINKKNFLTVVSNNLDCFRKELGEKITPEILLERIETRNTSLINALNKNYGLLGILLGYGAHNSLLFWEKLKVLRDIKMQPFLDRSIAKKKYEFFDSLLQNFNEFDDSPFLIQPLYFAADLSHPETQRLKSQYDEDRKRISNLISGKDFLEMVFDKLTEKKK